MKTYRVRWEIDVEAETPRAAAQQALDLQRNPASTATVFDVIAHDAPDQVQRVDLLTSEPDRAQSLGRSA